MVEIGLLEGQLVLGRNEFKSELRIDCMTVHLLSLTCTKTSQKKIKN
jgi:hypothetical protein